MENIEIKRIGVAQKDVFQDQGNGKGKLLNNSDYTLNYFCVGERILKQITLKDNPLSTSYFGYNKTSGFCDREKVLLGDSDLQLISFKKFYIEMAHILKTRLVLGYMIANDEEKEKNSNNIKYFLNNAHKYILREKFNLSLSDVIELVDTVSRNTFVPDEYVDQLMKELVKTIYNNELSKTHFIDVKRDAEVYFINEFKGKRSFTDKEYWFSILSSIEKKKKLYKAELEKIISQMNYVSNDGR